MIKKILVKMVYEDGKMQDMIIGYGLKNKGEYK